MCTSVSQRRVVMFLLASALAPAWAEDSSPDRIVAEWMLRMGGSVVLEGQRRPISDLAELPTSDFRLHTLNFSGVTQWAFALEDEMKRLPAIPHLKELYVNGRLWYDQPVTLVASTMRLLAGSPQLEKLRKAGSEQTGSNLHSFRRYGPERSGTADQAAGVARPSDANPRPRSSAVLPQTSRSQLRPDLQ